MIISDVGVEIGTLEIIIIAPRTLDTIRGLSKSQHLAEPRKITQETKYG